MKRDMKFKNQQKEFHYKISVTNDGKLEEFQQQFKVTEYGTGGFYNGSLHYYEDFGIGPEAYARLLKEEKNSLNLMKQITDQAENN